MCTDVRRHLTVGFCSRAHCAFRQLRCTASMVRTFLLAAETSAGPAPFPRYSQSVGRTDKTALHVLAGCTRCTHSTDVFFCIRYKRNENAFITKEIGLSVNSDNPKSTKCLLRLWVGPCSVDFSLRAAAVTVKTVMLILASLLTCLFL